MSTRSVTGTPPGGSPRSSGAPSEAEGAKPVVAAKVSGDGVEVEVAAAKGRVADGVDIEVFSATAKATRDQMTVAATMSRIEAKSDNGANSIAVEKLSVKVSAGRDNADGSRGVNLGIGANAVGIEGTVGGKGYGLTGGLSVGVGAEASVGVRDLDKDGNPELCARVSALFFTLGACAENPL